MTIKIKSLGAQDVAMVKNHHYVGKVEFTVHAEYSYQITDSTTGEVVEVLLNKTGHWTHCDCKLHRKEKPDRNILSYACVSIPCRFKVAALRYHDALTCSSFDGGFWAAAVLSPEREAYYAQREREINWDIAKLHDLCTDPNQECKCEQTRWQLIAHLVAEHQCEYFVSKNSDY